MDSPLIRELSDAAQTISEQAAEIEAYRATVAALDAQIARLKLKADEFCAVAARFAKRAEAAERERDEAVAGWRAAQVDADALHDGIVEAEMSLASERERARRAEDALREVCRLSRGIGSIDEGRAEAIYGVAWNALTPPPAGHETKETRDA